MHLKVFALALMAGGCSTANTTAKQNLLADSELAKWTLVVDDKELATVDRGFFEWAGRDGVHVLGKAPNGAPMPFAYLATKDSFANYRLSLQFRWGEKRFAPRQRDKRDAGVLVHAHGRPIVWPDSVELQIQEGDVGDAFTIDTQVTTTVVPESITSNVAMPEATHDPKGTKHTQGQDGITRIAKALSAERPGWNELQVIACADKLWFSVNGQLVNQLTDLRTWRPDALGKDTWIPLVAGKIVLQAEGAEIYYRGIAVEPLTTYAGNICEPRRS